MPKRYPEDFRGAWWHLTNRGIARRTVHETREDIERFCALLAELCREGLIAKCRTGTRSSALM